MSLLSIVSNRLPMRINERGDTERSAGGLASALEGAGMDDNTSWIGWSGISEEEIVDKPCYLQALEKAGVMPVPLTESDLNGYYEGYANSTLWPLLHYMTERARFNMDWMPVYRRVNEKFAEVTAAAADRGGTVWIHDYHLLLLPRMLRNLRPDLKIGFFLHTPFPSSEIFRALPERDEVLEGLLGADLIGFHTFSYLRHFRSSLLRILGIECLADNIRQGKREVRFGVYPIGHNRMGFHQAMQSATFADTLSRHSKEIGSRRLILSVERLDYTKGLLQKIAAIRQFLQNNLNQSSTVNFVIIAVPTRTGVEEYDELTENVQREVGAINGDYGQLGHSPLQFLHRSFSMEELAALYALADVCMVTPIVDGMNLVAKEFIDCKRKEYHARSGSLILSEFAGAAQEMSHAILVNPHDTSGVAKALELALAMPEDEQWARIQAMQVRLDRNDASAWATRFLNDLSKYPAHQSMDHTVENLQQVGENILKQLAQGNKVAIFLDYDGTLCGFKDHPEDAVPDAALCELLTRLASHPHIHLAIISGRSQEFLNTYFGKLPITLVAEHGYRWRITDYPDWFLVDDRVDNSWKEHIIPYLEDAVTLTPGSTLEIKQASVVWHYRLADPEFGLWRAKGLLSELTTLTANLPVSVHHGKKVVEVVSHHVNKGVAADLLLKKWKSVVAFAAGDDQTDESMFALHPSGLKHFHTVKVGEGDTCAVHRTDICELRTFLENLAQYISTRRRPSDVLTSHMPL